jgi:hypothetical protein
MSTSTITKLTISHNFAHAKVPEVQSQDEAAFTNMNAAAKLFPSPPVPLATFRQHLDSLMASSTAAMDGGRKEIKGLES